MTRISNAGRNTLTRVTAQCSVPYRPIVKAIRGHVCGYALVIQNTGRFKLPLSPFKPTIVVFGDDKHTSKSPAAFDQTSVGTVLGPCEAAFVIASSPEPETYAVACNGPVLLRRHALIVETLPAHEDEWIKTSLGVNPDIRMIVSKVDPKGWSGLQAFGRA